MDSVNFNTLVGCPRGVVFLGTFFCHFFFVYYCIMTKDADFSLVVDVLQDIFGEPHNHNDYRGQISFDCPVCSDMKGLDDGDGKGNLEINYMNYVYKCWSCAETENTKGHLNRLVRKYASPRQLKQFKLYTPEDLVKVVDKRDTIVRLPYEFVEFSKSSEGRQMTHKFREAFNYLKSRNITKEMIIKHRMGYCDSGPYENRIIIPSYDNKGYVNFFVARSFLSWTRMKYKNPQADKDSLIWNEHMVDWTKPVYLVEGVFDGLFLDNSIPMLGKFITEHLFMTLYGKAKKVVIVLDGDAWNDTEKLYHRMNAGKLLGKIWVMKLPMDRDIADMQGDLSEFKEIQLD